MERNPFPYLYIPSYMPAAVCEAIADHWPERQTMADEGAGLERSFAEIIHDDKLFDPRFGRGFWKKIIRTHLAPMIQDIANQFSPFIAAKFETPPDQINLRIHRLMCLQAEGGFVEHTPHAHSFSPNWVFTFLLYIDDDGREDRGTTLYGLRDLDWDTNGNGVLLGDQPGLYPAFKAPFRRGSLLAFYDSPVSIHGSTPFEGPSIDGSRRLIRGHVSLGPNEVRQIYGRDLATIDQEMLAEVGARKLSIDLSRDVALMKSFDAPRPTTTRVVIPYFKQTLWQSLRSAFNL